MKSEIDEVRVKLKGIFFEEIFAQLINLKCFLDKIEKDENFFADDFKEEFKIVGMKIDAMKDGLKSFLNLFLSFEKLTKQKLINYNENVKELLEE